MNTISLKLPRALETKLAFLARRRGTTKSAIVREALKEYLDRNGAGPSPSFAELAKEFIGCLDGGLPDLSYNKKHMERFGQ